MKKLLVLLFFYLLFTTIFAQTNDSVSIRLTKALDSIYTQNQLVGFSVAIVNQNGTLYERGFGYADIQTNKKYTNYTIQNIASISKTFIGVALLKAQELGKLRLDDPINKYLPFEVVNPYFPEELITIRHLATHVSSIKDPSRYEKNGYVLKEKVDGDVKAKGNFRSPDEMITQSQFLENILSKEGKWYKKKNFLQKKPGEIFEYSNIAAGLAALVLESATNVSFGDFTKKHILKPLGMSNSGWSFAEVDFSKHTKLYLNMETELAYYQLVNYPDGGLITSVAELGKYLTELIAGYNGKGNLLTIESYQELFRQQLSNANYSERNESTYNDEYNMGIFMGFSAKGQIGHTGGDPGVVTHMFFDSTSNIGKILIVNTDVKKDGIKEFIDIWKQLEAYEIKF